MNRKTMFSLIAIVIVGIIAVASYFWNAPEIQTNNNNKNNSSNTAIVKNKEDKETPLKGFDKEKASNFEKSIESKMPEVDRIEKGQISDSIEGFSNEEVESAGTFVSDYIHEAHANTYFLGGEWGRNGNDIGQLQGVLGKYYAKGILDKLDKYEDNKESKEFIEKVTGMIPYFDESSVYAPSEYCSISGDAKTLSVIKDGEATIVDGFNDCPIDLKISEIQYESVKKDNINVLNVYFNTKATYPLFSKELNADAKTVATYKYGLELSPKFSDSSKLEWEITSYNVDVSFSKIEKVKG